MGQRARFDPGVIFAALTRRDVRFVVIGGLAGAAQGAGWPTFDADRFMRVALFGTAVSAVLFVSSGAFACTCRVLGDPCRTSPIVAVVEVEGVEPLDTPGRVRVRTRILHVERGAELLQDGLELTMGGQTSCSLSPWNVGDRVRVFLASPTEALRACSTVEQLPRDAALPGLGRCARGGCASCAVGARREPPWSSSMAAALLLLACVRRCLTRPERASRQADRPN